jgi:hypothetical protein
MPPASMQCRKKELDLQYLKTTAAELGVAVILEQIFCGEVRPKTS